jgi:hypothetical protein
VVPAGTILLFWPGSLLLENLIFFPATHYLDANQLDPSLFLFVAALLLFAAWHLRRSSSRVIWFLMALQAALFMTALQRADLNHITGALFPLLALLPLLLSKATESSVMSRIVVVTGLLALIAPLSLFLARNSWTAVFNPSQHPAVRYVRENCARSQYIYAGPFAPELYFAAGKLNPTRYSVLLTSFNTKTQFIEARKDIEAHRPPCVVTNYAVSEKFAHNKNNAVDEFILMNYEVAYQSGHRQVWMSKANPPRDSYP